jgi:hypothetical protein
LPPNLPSGDSATGQRFGGSAAKTVAVDSSASSVDGDFDSISQPFIQKQELNYKCCAKYKKYKIYKYINDVMHVKYKKMSHENGAIFAPKTTNTAINWRREHGV